MYGMAATVNGHAYFAGGGNFSPGFNSPVDAIDIYDEASGTWATDVLFEPIHSLAMLGVGDYLVVGGGVTGDGSRTSLVQECKDERLIKVEEDYQVIQEAINASSHNDTVLVYEDTYYENINYYGKAILLASEFLIDGDTNHINNTIINGSQPVNPDIGSVVTFTSGEDTTTVLCGFTITGGTGTDIPSVVRMGGGIFMTVSGGKLLNNHIEYNNASGEGWSIGGGIGAAGPITPLPWVVLRGNRITNNKAKSSEEEGDGGGIECFYNLIMTDNQISYNEAIGPFRGDGGGVRIRSDFGHVEVNIRNNIITHNKAVSLSDGTDLALSGGLNFFWDISGSVSNNVISYNEIEVAADKWGYGTGVLVELLDLPDPDFVFENNFVTNNNFSGGYCMGGGMCIYTSGGKFLNNAIQNNKATKGGGIAIEYNTSVNTAILINNNITGNTADWGGGIFMKEAEAVMINSIVWGNNAPNGASIWEETSIPEVRYSDVEGDEAWPGEGNVNCSPAFLEDGYHLDFSTPLLNAGITNIEVNGVWYNCPALDIDGEPRPFFGTPPEIGVDELQTTVSVGRLVSSEDVAVSIFPNPANRMVTISAESGSAVTRVTIYDTQGQPVYTGIPVNNMLDVSTLQPGIYILEARCGEKESRQKLIIE